MDAEQNPNAGCGIVDVLAAHLYSAMERLDPSAEEIDWAALTPSQQEFYRACVYELLAESMAIYAAAELGPASPVATQ